MFEPQPQTLFPTSDQMADIGNTITPLPAIASATAGASATADTLPPRAPDSLDLTFGAAIPKESEAFAAYYALKQERQAPGTIPADRLPQLKATLKDYATTARAYNRPLFAEQTTIQRASQVRHTQKLLAGLDKLPEALSPEQVKALDERAKLHPDPDAYRARQINRTLLDMAYGKKVKPENYELARDHYAKTVLGSTTPLDDKAFYSAMQTRAQKQQGAEKLLSEKLDSLLSDTVAGKQWNIKTYLGEIKDAMPDIDDTTLESMESELRLKRRQFTDLKRTVTPIAQALTDFTFARGDRADAIKYTKTPGAAPMPQSEFEAAQRFMALTPEQRTMTAAMIAQELETMPEDQRPAALRAALGTGRKFREGLQYVADIISANYYAGKQFLKDDARPEGDATVQGAGQLRQLSTKAAADMLRPSDGFLAKVGILSAAQIPYLFAAASGAGTALLGASMAGDSYVQARTNRPDTDPNKQLMAATVSGAAQAVVERASFKVLTGAVKGTGKLTGFLTGKYGTESMLRLAGVTNKFARYAAGYTIGTAVITGTEYGEEVAQEFIDTGLQDLATTMSGIDPDTDYLALLKSWNPTGEKGVKTILALLPLAIIGGLGAGAHHFKHGEILLRNRSALTAVGIAPDRIDAIASNPDIAAATQEFREAFQEGASQKLDDAQRAEAAAQFESHLAGIKELAQQAGMEIIAEDTDFAEMGEDPRFVLRLPDQEPQLFNSREEAETALRESIEQQIQDSHDIALESLTGSMVDFLKSENQSGQNVQVNQRDFAGDFDTLIKKGLATREQVRARLELYAMEAGLTMPQLQQKINSGAVDLRIMARAYSQQLTNGATKYFVDLFQGADPLSAAEDFSENHWQHLLSSGMVDAPTAIGWLLEAQEKTGYQYLPTGLTAGTYTPAQRMALIEGLSKASVQYLLGQSQSEQLPAGFRGWLEKMVIAMGQAWTWAKQLMASTKLREAIENNQLPARFVAELADSVGLNDEARNRRAEKEAEAQAMAEFLGDHTKLSEFAKGRLLHPAKAREMDSPFAGELQRIYDHFVYTDRVVRHTSKGVEVDYKVRVAKANKFFAPVDEAVNLDDLRQRMTEEGFPNMTTISDMLTQIEEVLSIEGLEIYATHSSLTAQNAAAGYGPTFSMVSDPSNRSNLPDLPTVKTSIVKVGIKINGETYNLRNPAPQDLALAAAVQLANKEKDPTDRAWRFGNVLGDTKNQDALSILWVKDYQNALRQQGAQAKQTKQTRAQQEQAALENLFGISASEIIDAIKITVSSYYQQKRGTPTLSQLVYRGESAAPTIASITDSGMGDVSNISKSQYPLIRITLANGGELYQKIRISDHGQVSTNAPRSYDHDYRADNLKDALENTSLMEDMQAVADALWQEQKNALPDTANGAPYTPIQDRDGSLTGQESRQSQDGVENVTNDGTRQQNSFSIGSTTVTPGPNTRTFPTADGGLIGPATFSLVAESYGIPHRPNEEGPRAFDLAENDMMPGDVYDHPEWYSAMDAKIIRETMAQLRKAKNKPDADLTIYRAGPAPEMNPGDWVSLSKEYARTHADSQDPDGYKVWKANVKAKDVRWDMNDLAEFGYFGETTAAEDSGITFSIAAYHGTPHKVDKFSLNKIGTGEGAQAYGWGLYFAQAQEVAKQYQDRLTNNTLIIDGVSAMQKRTETDNYVWGHASHYYADGARTKEALIAKLEDARKYESDRNNKYIPDANYAEVIDALTAANEVAQGNTGNLYTVTLNVEDEDLLDWDKPLNEQSEKVKQALITLVQQQQEIFPTLLPNGFDINRLAGNGVLSIAGRRDSDSLGGDRKATESLLAAGIRGIRYLDGNSRSDGQGTYNYVIFDEADITITEENGNPLPSPLITDNSALNTFSLSALTGSPLHTLLAQKAAAGPSERAEIMEGIRTRLQALEYKLEARGSGELTEMEKQLLGWRARTDLTPEQRERLRIEDALAQVKAVLNAVPAEIRAKIAVPMTRILDAQTEKTTTNAFAELIENLDEELEFHLRGEYTEAISRILDIAQPTMSESRQSKGKLIVETNRLIAAINEALSLDALNLALELSTTEASITELERELESIPEEEAETRAKVQARLDATQERQFLLYHFGGIGSKDSRELAQSLKILRDAYTRGRIARQVLDQERRAWIARMRYDVRTSLDAPRGVTGPAHARATEKKNLAKGWAWNLMSIHNLLEVLFPYSQFAAEVSQRLITAQRNVTRARLAAKDRFNAFMDETFGTTNQRQRNKIIRALHERRNWKTMISEVDGTRMEKLTIDQAQRILAGTLKPGWENEKDTMILLQQAWRDYLAKPKRAREATQFIEVSRVVSRKPAVALRLSDMDALYVLQLARQEEYIPALQTYGYTPEVLAEIRRDIDPRALEFMRFYGREYDENWSTMNPVFQELYHMDMPRIRNYAPGAFFNVNDKNDLKGDPMGNAAPMGAMNFGATKNRRAHRSRPRQYSAHAVYMGHVDRSTYWVEFAQIARDMGMIFRETETRRALEVKHGPEAAAELLTWLDNIANDGAIDAAARLASNTIAQNIAAGQAIAGLSFNLSVPFKQFGAALGSLWFISPAQAIRAFARALFRPQAFAYVWKSEAIQQRIREGFSPEDRAMLDAAEISPSELYRLHSIARLPITYADAAFTTISGAIAYDHHYTESRAGGMDHARAHEAAMQFMDRVVFLTAQPADTQTKSNWEIQNKGYGKLLTLFKSDPRKQIGLLFADLAKAKAGNLSKAKLAERFLTQWMTYGLVAYVGGAAFRAIAQDDEDDRPVWDWKELLAAMLIGPVEGAGLFGSVIQAGIRLATGTRHYSNTGNPLSDSLLRTASTMKDFDITSMDTVKLLATITQLGSVKNPLWGLVPAAMRGIDQITNAMDNLSESDDERLERLAREYNTQAKETAKAEARRIDDLATSATPLDQIPEEDRKKVEKKRNTATEEETAPPLIQSLKKMSERTRTEKITYILEGLPTEAERETFRAMLRTHGIPVTSDP